MLTDTARNLVLAMAIVLVASPLLSGCVVEAGPPVGYVEGYAPAYYDGYVVYYDTVGRPYYYVNGAVVWVPPGAPGYPGLVAHWRTYGPAYNRWYVNHGYRYRAYRRR
jgi:hypothetical protein